MLSPRSSTRSPSRRKNSSAAQAPGPNASASAVKSNVRPITMPCPGMFALFEADRAVERDHEGAVPALEWVTGKRALVELDPQARPIRDLQVAVNELERLEHEGPARRPALPCVF